MPDYPSTLISSQPLALSTWGLNCLALDVSIAQGANAAAGSAWPSNNLGVFCPVWVDQPVTVYQMAIGVTTQSGNVDVGIYDLAGNALVRAGSTAVAAAGIQIFNIADTILMPGIYFLGMACSTTGAAFRGTTTNAITLRSVGVQTMVNAFSTGLVDPVTYAGTLTAYHPLLVASLVPTI